MATAGKITIAEVEEIVEPGEIAPGDVHVPGIYVQRIVKGDSFEKRIEVSFFFCSFCFMFYLFFFQKRTVQQESSNSDSTPLNDAAKRRERIIRRAALEFEVNQNNF